jgi:hypothetical protein
MSNSNLPQYTFLSWYRRGLGNYITTVDDATATGPLGMPSITFELEINDDNTNIITQDIDILGPGHISGINERVMIKTFPQNKVQNAEYTNLAYVEFYDEDFPWRYTPAKADGNKIRPWVSLLVLKEGEFNISYSAASPLPFITMPSTLSDNTTPNPALDIPSENIWAWAHVQINKALVTDINDPAKQEELTNEVNALIAGNPDVALSRLVSPRKLEAEAKYSVFLIPSFEVGRKAGLGEDTSTTGVLEPSWKPDDLLSDSKDMPFYFHWDFATGADGDFESLAKKIEPKTIDSLPQRTINIESLGLHFADEIAASSMATAGVTKTLELGAALMPQIFTLASWPNSGNADLIVFWNMINDLSQHANTANANELEDPIVNIPPIYGQHYMNLNTIQANSWLHQANLTPRDRAITALGAEIVKKHQETFMTHAYEKLGEILEINKRLYQAQLGKEVSHRIFEKHLDAKSDAELIAQTGNLHQKVLNNSGSNPTTISRTLKKSNLDNSAVNSGFVKLRRTGGKTGKKLSNQIQQHTVSTQRGILSENLIKNINNNTSLSGIQGSLPKTSPYLYGAAQNALTNQLSNSSLSNTIFQYEPSLDLVNTKNTIKTALNPQNTYPKKVQNQVVFNNSNNDELIIPPTNKIDPIMATPKIDLPLYQYLVDLSQDFIIPDITDLGNNYAALFEVDQSFVEKVMLGANHEMTMELLWRGYPTDQRGTVFNHFWDTRDNPNSSTPRKDITDIHTWGNTLIGTHNPSSAGITALVIKGDLLEAYPNTVIYAHQGVFNPNVSTILSTSTFHTNQTSISVDPALPSLEPAPTTTVGADRLLNPIINNQTVRYPIFKAKLEPNIIVLGFDLGVDELLGRVSANQQPTLPGWFFMFKERPGEPRFGLDDNTDALSPLGSWDELAWQHLTSANYVDLSQPLTAAGSSVNWNEDAASMAHILYQSPILMGIHAAKIITP